MITFLPAVFVGVLTIPLSTSGDSCGLGRLVFLLTMFSLSYFF